MEPTDDFVQQVRWWARTIVIGRPHDHQQHPSQVVTRGTISGITEVHESANFQSRRVEALGLSRGRHRSFGLSLDSLPDDVLIEILCWELAPDDLVAVGHTCRALRSCANSEVVWLCALERWESEGRINLPLARPPILAIGPTEMYDTPIPPLLLNPKGFKVRSLPISSSPLRINWRDEAVTGMPHDTAPPTSDNDHTFARKLFQNAMLLRRTLANSPHPTVEALLSVSLNRKWTPSGDLLPAAHPTHMNLSTRGDILALWAPSGKIHIVYLRSRPSIVREYVLDVDLGGLLRDQTVFHCEVGAFRHREQEGVVVVVDSHHSLNVLFQPFCLEGEPRAEPSIVYALALRHETYSITFKLSGHWLLFTEREPMVDSMFMTVVDLTSGRRWATDWYLRRGHGGLINAEILNNEYVIASLGHSWPRIFRLIVDGTIITLENDDLVHDPTLVGDFLPWLVSIPREVSKDPDSGCERITCWHDCEDGLRSTDLKISSPTAHHPTAEESTQDSDGSSRPLLPNADLQYSRSAVQKVNVEAFGDPDEWDAVTSAWYDGGTNQMFHRLTKFLSSSTPNPRSAAVKPEELPYDEPYSITHIPYSLHSKAVSGDSRHCLTLACPFSVARKNRMSDFPLRDRAHVLITRLRQNRVEHRRLFVRELTSERQSEARRPGGQMLNHDAAQQETPLTIRYPLQVRDAHKIQWNPLAGVLAKLEEYPEGYTITVYRVVVDDQL